MHIAFKCHGIIIPWHNNSSAMAVAKKLATAMTQLGHTRPSPVKVPLGLVPLKSH